MIHPPHHRHERAFVTQWRWRPGRTTPVFNELSQNTKTGTAAWRAASFWAVDPVTGHVRCPHYGDDGRSRLILGKEWVVGVVVGTSGYSSQVGQMS
jgi:hypothetical protein